MPITYESSIIDGRLQVVNVAIGSNGRIQIGTAGMAQVLSTVILSTTAGIISSGVFTFRGTPLVDPFAAATGVAAAGRITNSAGSVVMSGLTVTSTSGNGDILISLINIAAGSIVTFVSGAYTGR